MDRGDPGVCALRIHLREAEERNLRILLAAMITVSLGLAAIMAKGFHWF